MLKESKERRAKKSTERVKSEEIKKAEIYEK
jgi:hypothetical protein